MTAHGSPPKPRVPFRQIARLAHELHFNGLRNLGAVLPHRYDRGVVWMLVARCCLPDWTRGEALQPPATPTIFASINSLAASLGRPYETIRNHVHALVREGLCVSDTRGVALSAAADVVGRTVDFLVATHDVFLRFAEDVSRVMDVPEGTGPAVDAKARILKPALDIQLAPFELLRASFVDWTGMMVWALVAGGSVRHITLDPVLSARYAEDLPPDTERRPVTLAALEGVTGLPYSTVWRHVKRLEIEGLLVRRDKGWSVGVEYYQAPGVERGTRVAVAYYCRRVAEAARLGAGRQGAAAAYLRERPALVSFTTP